MTYAEAADILGVSLQNLTHGSLKQAYHRMCKTYHPDCNSSNDTSDVMKKINEAKRTLDTFLQYRPYGYTNNTTNASHANNTAYPDLNKFESQPNKQNYKKTPKKADLFSVLFITGVLTVLISTCGVIAEAKTLTNKYNQEGRKNPRTEAFLKARNSVFGLGVLAGATLTCGVVGLSVLKRKESKQY